MTISLGVTKENYSDDMRKQIAAGTNSLQQREPLTNLVANAGGGALKELTETTIKAATTPHNDFLMKLNKSLEVSFEFSRSIILAPRVQAWRDSAETGLRHYHYHTAPDQHYLTKEEMILSHRFPDIFFTMIFDKNFSKETQEYKGVEISTKHTSIVIINGEKRILEAVIDSRTNTLFHFYLKPKKIAQDKYYEMTKDSHAEFPTLTSLLNPKSKTQRSLDLKGFTLDPDGHIVLRFEGNHYKVLNLSGTDDLDLVA